MFGNGVGNGIVDAFALGIIASHDALQFGEFTDHAGHQIGLAQHRRLPHGCGIRARNPVRQLDRQCFETRHLVRQTAEFFVEHHIPQMR